MTDLVRKDQHPELGFFELPFPAGDPPLEPPAPDADGNALTMFAWSRAHCFLELLAARFPEPPRGARWGADVYERERFVGEWPDGDYEMSAYVGIGLLIEPNDAAARAFAERVRAEAPKRW